MTMDFDYSYTSPNFWTVDPAHDPIEAICLHGTAGSTPSALQELTSVPAQVSANFLISKTGKVYCLVDPYQNKRAWANGIVRSPDTNNPLIAKWIGTGLNPNNRTISIEHEAASQDMYANNYASMPDAQAKASRQLVVQLCRDFHLPIDRTHIIGHNQIDSISRHYCPGVIDIGGYVGELIIETVGAATVNNLDPNGDPNAWHCVQPGLDFWVVQPILKYWRDNGGLTEFGYPVSGQRPMHTDPAKTCQYFERARLEVDKNGVITRGRVGAELLAAQGNNAP